jgi:hypothetical protein
MKRICRMVAVPLALAALFLVGTNRVAAQGVIVTQPPVVSYYTPPVAYPYAPVVSYYPPAPTVSYYYAPPVVAYSSRPVVTYAPPPAVVYPSTTVTTYRSGVFFPRRTVVTQYTTPAYYP